MAKVAGGSLLSLQTFLTRAHGDDAFDRVLARMPPGEADSLRGIVMPVNWYPTHAFIRAIETAQALFGQDDLLERYGAFAAEFEIRFLQRVALRFTSPTYLLERAGRMWHRFHDTGEWDVEGDDHHMTGSLREFAVVDASYCRVLVAWLRRAGEMTGARGDVTHPECRARGGAACVFTGWWE